MSSYTTILGFDPSTAQLYQLWLGAKTCLLGLNEEIPSDSQNRDLLHILLYSRSEMYPGYRWVNEEPPTLNQWLSTVSSIIQLEAFSTALKNKPFSILSDLG